ncbi:MAG: hypothetical protein HQM09_17880 [Candidatus Riflebacteria bacterium]|nr:hypothetical protein [Candidatus Riflebacteria bacterium]
MTMSQETSCISRLTLPPIICLTGIDGCGKSTHVRRVENWLAGDSLINIDVSPVNQDNERPADNKKNADVFDEHTGGLSPRRIATLSVWDITRLSKYHSHPFISDKRAIHEYLGKLSGPARALFILHALHESLEAARQTGATMIIADGYWYKYVFTEYLHGCDLEWLLAAVGAFPKPSITIMLDLPPEASWARKPMVTPYECGFAPPCEDAFLSFQRRLRATLLDRASRDSWSIVPCNRPEAETAEAIHDIIIQKQREITTSLNKG